MVIEYETCPDLDYSTDIRSVTVYVKGGLPIDVEGRIDRGEIHILGVYWHKSPKQVTQRFLETLRKSDWQMINDAIQNY